MGAGVTTRLVLTLELSLRNLKQEGGRISRTSM